MNKLHDHLIKKGIFNRIDNERYEFCGQLDFDQETENLCFSFGLLNICQSIRMNCNGSADDMTDLEIVFLLRYLQFRLRHWGPTVSQYDGIVKDLIKCVCREVLNSHRYQKWIVPRFFPSE
jgi:hypothetical protein